MAGIELQRHLHGGVGGVLLHGLHHAAHLGRHHAVGADGEGGRVHQAVGGLHVGDAVAEGGLEPLGEGFYFAVRQVALVRGRLGGVGELGVGAVGGDELLAVELAHVVHHVFVHRLGAEEHLEAAGLEAFEVGAGLDGGAGRADEVVDLGLAFLQAGDVVGERGGLAGLGEGGLVAEEFNEGVLVGPIEGGALLEEHAELGVELVVFLGAVLGLVGEELEEAGGDGLADLLEQGLVLHRLARDVERDVGAVHDALHEAHPVRQQALGRGIDEHLAAIERHGRLGFREAHALRVFRRSEDQRVDRERRVGGEVQAIGRLVPCLACKLIERLVFVLADLGLILEPECLHLVDALAIEQDREADEVAIGLDEVFHAGLGGVFGAILLEVQHHLRTAIEAAGFLDFVARLTVAGPDEFW